jgi:hypothetical protein
MDRLARIRKAFAFWGWHTCLFHLTIRQLAIIMNYACIPFFVSFQAVLFYDVGLETECWISY